MPKRNRSPSSSPGAAGRASSSRRRVVDSDSDLDLDSDGDGSQPPPSEPQEQPYEPEPGSVREFDLEVLRWITECPQIWDHELAGLERYARVANDNNGAVNVHYKRFGEGRFYVTAVRVLVRTTRDGPEYRHESVGTPCTNMWREVRATLYADGHLDVDQVCSHQRFLLALVRDCDTIQPAEYKCLQDYVERRVDTHRRSGAATPQVRGADAGVLGHCARFAA